MSQTHLPSVQPYHPTTFLERGVSIPFTTPMLGGARARPGGRPGNGQALELIVPNPSGGRGVYIMPWQSITTLCRPTLHDKVFNTRIGGLAAVTPAVIRRIAGKSPPRASPARRRWKRPSRRLRQKRTIRSSPIIRC